MITKEIATTFSMTKILMIYDVCILQEFSQPIDLDSTLTWRSAMK